MSQPPGPDPERPPGPPPPAAAPGCSGRADRARASRAASPCSASAWTNARWNPIRSATRSASAYRSSARITPPSSPLNPQCRLRTDPATAVRLTLGTWTRASTPRSGWCSPSSTRWTSRQGPTSCAVRRRTEPGCASAGLPPGDPTGDLPRPAGCAPGCGPPPGTQPGPHRRDTSSAIALSAIALPGTALPGTALPATPLPATPLPALRLRRLSAGTRLRSRATGGARPGGPRRDRTAGPAGDRSARCHRHRRGGAGRGRPVGPAEDLPGRRLPLGVLRPLEEPVPALVLHGRVRRPGQEPGLPRAAAPPEPRALGATMAGGSSGRPQPWDSGLAGSG